MEDVTAPLMTLPNGAPRRKRTTAKPLPTFLVLLAGLLLFGGGMFIMGSWYGRSDSLLRIQPADDQKSNSSSAVVVTFPAVSVIVVTCALSLGVVAAAIKRTYAENFVDNDLLLPIHHGGGGGAGCDRLNREILPVQGDNHNDDDGNPAWKYYPTVHQLASYLALLAAVLVFAGGMFIMGWSYSRHNSVLAIEQADDQSDRDMFFLMFGFILCFATALGLVFLTFYCTLRFCVENSILNPRRGEARGAQQNNGNQPQDLKGNNDGGGNPAPDNHPPAAATAA